MNSRRIAGSAVAFVVKVTLAAVVGILLLKGLVAKLPVPGLAQAVNAV